MTSDGDRKLEFRPRARIIRTIGDQLISGPEAAVIELVKNAYDADASYVSVKFFPPLEAGAGRIVIRDDGHGMTLSDIRDKWMEPATASKVGDRVSAIKKRAVMGSKGIGRFASAKLGAKMALSTVSDRDGEPIDVLIPEIDWSIFGGDTYLSDISIDYLVQPATSGCGTEIEIRELNESWTDTKLARLHLELRRLVSPIQQADEDQPFRIYLDLSECTDVSAGFDGDALINGAKVGAEPSPSDAFAPYEVRPFPLLTTCDYEVKGEFDGLGRFHGSMTIRRDRQEPYNIELDVLPSEDEQPCGIVKVQLYIFDREASVIKQTMQNAGLGAMTATEARQILNEIAGIAIYRDGFRVRPYGDRENDWLTLDARRVNEPSLRIGHNQIAGFITVEGQTQSGLVERSSREGFEENGSFRRLARLVRELLAQKVEPRRYDHRVKTGLSRSKDVSFDEVRKLSGLKSIRQLVSSLPAEKQASAEAVIDRESQKLSDRIEVLEERQRVLEAQSSLGAIISEVLHEGGPAAAFIVRSAKPLSGLFRNLLEGGEGQDRARAEIPGRLALLMENGTKLATLFANLRPLSGGRRGAPEVFRAADPIVSARELFRQHETRIEITGAWDVPPIKGYPSDLHTAMVNLVGNSIYWLEKDGTSDPSVTVTLKRDGADLLIYVDDNGPGIDPETADRIFDVGFSLKDDGTGLGLNIAREALARSQGRLFLHMEYEGGTRFEIRFPLAEATK